MSTNFVAESFVNDLGQTINPGDEVIYIGSGYSHSTKVRRGVFDGVYKETYRPYDFKTRSYLDEHVRVSAVRVGGVKDTRWNYNYDTGEGKHVDIVRKAILPLKRVYKIDTSFAALDGKSF